MQQKDDEILERRRNQIKELKEINAKRKNTNWTAIENDKKANAKLIKEKRLRDEESVNRARKLDQLHKEGNKEII